MQEILCTIAWYVMAQLESSQKCTGVCRARLTQRVVLVSINWSFVCGQ